MQGIHKAHTTFKLKKHKLLLLPFSLFTLTLLSAYFLSHIPTASHATSLVDRVSVSIDSITCTMEGSIASGNEHTTTISNGTSKEGIGVTELRTVCNDANGYSIYAIGFSGTLNDPYNNAELAGRTDMVGITTGNKIATGTYDSTLPISDSLWSMKLIVDEDSYLPSNLTIENNFDEYHEVPSFYTKVASYSTKTGEAPNGVSTIKTTYAASISDTQTPDTYIGQVKYTMVHPDSGLDTSITFNDAFQLSGKTPVEDTILYKMQDMNAVICNRVTSGQTSELMDIRDNKIYTVAKINGDCWMTQNLAFTGTSLDSETSNVASNYTKINPYTVSMTNGTGNGYFSLDGTDSSYTNHCDRTNGYNYSCIKDSGNTTTGVWYNYVAATAGTITGSSNENEAYYSVCPKGWKLPTGAASTEGTDFYGLFQSTSYRSWASINNDYLDAFSAVSGGDYYDGALNYEAYGFWWSATHGNAAERYYLGYYSSNTRFLSDDSLRYIGFFIRCIADNTMQGLTSDDAGQMALNETIQLRDLRDDNIYPVARLADGNVWLLDDLRLGSTSSISLSPNDTNLTAGRTWSLPAYNSSNDTSSANGGNANTAASINIANSNESLSISNYVDGYSGTIGKRGAYYNYCAVSAGTACENQNADIAITVLEEDICPKGWKVPSASTMYDFPAYYESNNDALKYLRIAFTGQAPYSNATLDSRFGEMGSFWESSIAAGAQNANRLYITRDEVNTITALNWTGTSGRGNRYPVRCLLRTE